MNVDPRDPHELVDYVSSLDCIHCGLCLNTCPTYRLTGVETSSPRGRIHLMRALAEGSIEADAPYAEELDFCLLCRHCETVCPSGVQFGHLMEHARGALEPQRVRGAFGRMVRRLGFDLLLRDRAALRAAAAVGRAAQTTGLDLVLARIAGRGLREAPRVPARSRRARLPVLTRAVGVRRGAVAMLEGCVMPELLGETNRATVRVLAACGFDVHVAREHVCCGSLHAHNGESTGARALALETIAAFDALVDEDGRALPIVVNSAGCGAHMKELAAGLSGSMEAARRARDLSARTFDFAEFLTTGPGAPGLDDLSTLAPRARDVPTVRVTWDDPCHLIHGQRIHREPRAILRRIAGVDLVEMDGADGCCGSAGIYSLTRPDDAQRVLDPKLEALRACGADVLVTANPGCQLQWSSGIRRAGLAVRVRHLAELLDERLVSAAFRARPD